MLHRHPKIRNGKKGRRRKKERNNGNKLLKCTKEKEEEKWQSLCWPFTLFSNLFVSTFAKMKKKEEEEGNLAVEMAFSHKQTDRQTICGRTYHSSTSSATYDVSKTLCMRILTNDRQGEWARNDIQHREMKKTK